MDGDLWDWRGGTSGEDRSMDEVATRRRTMGPVGGPGSRGPECSFGGDSEPVVVYSPDSDPDVMRMRKRAMVTGRFCFIDRGSGEEFEASKEFQAAVRQWYVGDGREGPRFGPKPGAVSVTGNRMEATMRKRTYRTRFTVNNIDFPGVGDRYHVAWSTPSGGIRVDASVKLYDLRSVQYSYEVFEDLRRGKGSPMSERFGLVEPFLTQDGQVGFDANLFWSVGLLFKHFSTCGMEAWDKDLARLERAALDQEVEVRHGKDDGTKDNNEEGHDDPEGVFFPAASTRSSGQAVVGDLPADRTFRYTGCVMEWRGTYGFLSCNHIPAKVFLHCSEVSGWQAGQYLPYGTSVNFAVVLDPARGYRAVEAKLFT